MRLQIMLPFSQHTHNMHTHSNFKGLPPRYGLILKQLVWSMRSSRAWAAPTSPNLYNITCCLLTTLHLHGPSFSSLNTTSYFLLWGLHTCYLEFFCPTLPAVVSLLSLNGSTITLFLIVYCSFPPKHLPWFSGIYLWVHFVVPLEVRNHICYTQYSNIMSGTLWVLKKHYF